MAFSLFIRFFECGQFQFWPIVTFFDFDFFDFFFFYGLGRGSLTRRVGGPLRVGEGGYLTKNLGGARTYVRVLLLAERARASAGECRWDPGAVVSGAAKSRKYKNYRGTR